MARVCATLQEYRAAGLEGVVRAVDRVDRKQAVNLWPLGHGGSIPSGSTMNITADRTIWQHAEVQDVERPDGTTFTRVAVWPPADQDVPQRPRWQTIPEGSKLPDGAWRRGHTTIYTIPRRSDGLPF